MCECYKELTQSQTLREKFNLYLLNLFTTVFNTNIWMVDTLPPIKYGDYWLMYSQTFILTSLRVPM